MKNTAYLEGAKALKKRAQISGLRTKWDKFLMSLEKKIVIRVEPPKASNLVHKICGCKWSLTVFKLLENGINRPGEMVRAVDGLSTKVLNDCLRRNLEFGLIERTTYPEIPPRVEYSMTEFGHAFVRVMSDLEDLDRFDHLRRKEPPKKAAQFSKIDAGA